MDQFRFVIKYHYCTFYGGGGCLKSTCVLFTYHTVFSNLVIKEYVCFNYVFVNKISHDILLSIPNVRSVGNVAAILKLCKSVFCFTEWMCVINILLFCLYAIMIFLSTLGCK